LEVLYCQRNKLKTLPENLKDLKGLKELECSNNPNLTTLPELPESLKELNATDCPLTEETKERIRRHKNYNPRRFRF